MTSFTFTEILNLHICRTETHGLCFPGLDLDIKLITNAEHLRTDGTRV